MKRELAIILEELRRLKEEGVTVLNVSEETLLKLRERARGFMTSGARGQPDAAQPETTGNPPRSRFETAGSGRLPDFNPGPNVEPGVTPKTAAATEKLPPPPTVKLPTGSKQVQWEALRRQATECPVSIRQLKEGGQLVFGVGNLDADIFMVGEAPGADEEEAGEPFVGKAGELLTGMIRGMGLDRKDVYITNIMSWRPPTGTDTGNRAPNRNEIEFCLPYLRAQIEIVQPKVIVALGNTAVAGLFGPDPKRKLQDVRGEWKEYKDIPTIITYHPSYLVRNGSRAVKRIVWEDLLKVMEKVGLEVSDKQRGYFLPKE
jgi:DNA polymerase